MKKSKLLIAVLAATMFVLAAFGLIACDKDAGDLGGATTPTGVYTITLNYGEGSGTLSTTVTANGKIVTLPTPSAPTGKKFDAWYDAATGGKKVTTSTTFDKNATIYARYTDNSTVTTGVYTITFDYNGGTGTPASAQTTDGKLTLTALPTPTTAPEGKTFDAWYDAAEGGNKVDLDKVYTADTTIHAQYTGGGQQEEGGNKVYVGGNVVATLSEGTTAGMAYDYYASDIELSAGDVVTFSIEGATIAVVWVDESSKLEEKGTNIDVTGNKPEVTVTESGTYTVSIKQSTADSTNGSNKWQIWAGIPGGSLTEGMVATAGGNQENDKPNIYLIKDGDRTQGYFVTYTGTNGDGYDEYSVTVTLEAGDSVSIYVPDWGDNGAGWECYELNPYTDSAIAETSGNYIVMKEGGTFTFYFQTKYGSDRVYIGR